MSYRRLQKYIDFKRYIDDYLNGEIDKNEILELLEILRRRYDRQHSALLEPLERDLNFYKKNQHWIDPLREAAIHFEDARDIIEEAIVHDEEEGIDEALEIFKEGNILLNDTMADLDDMLEQSPLLDIL